VTWPDGVDVHTVVVVTGAVVGATYTVVGVVVRTVVDVDPRDVVVVVVGAVVVVVGLVMVVVGLEATTRGALAATPTRTADVAAEPITMSWVKRRTRAKRLSRCWGVRCLGVIRFPGP
jgi:sulfite exporter TauE/SafE